MKEKLIEVLDGLVKLINEWNESESRSNDALCIQIWDDGSGKISTQFGEFFNQQFEFSNVEELANYLMDWLE